MISPETVEAVKQYPDIVAIISDYVSLKRRGRNFIGLCPFHSEKTPSFTVSPEKKLFHCFGCQVSGDHIGFVMQMDNVSFAEAIRHIAGRMGITIVEKELTSEQAKQRSEREELQRLFYAVREAFSSYLEESTDVRDYLSSRGITWECASRFYLGYSPADFDLAEFLLAYGFSETLFANSGLFYQDGQGRFHSRFKKRLIFPVLDQQGRTVGFGGRILTDATDTAKYMNSEETPYFSKRRILFGLDQAKTAIREKDSVLLMEGYLDVMMSHQHGFQHAVGTMGTALTLEHVQLLKRYVHSVYLAMDQDEAGIRAMERSVELLRQHDMRVWVVKLDRKDPADVLQNFGAEHFQKLIDQAQPMWVFKLDLLAKGRKQIPIEEVPEMLVALLPIIQMEKDAVVRRNYIKNLADRLGIDEELIMVKLKKSSYNVRDRLVLSSMNKKHRYQKAEESLIYLITSDLTIRYQFLEMGSHTLFVTPILSDLVKIILNSEESDQKLVDSLGEEIHRQELSRILIEGEVQGVSVTDQWQDYIQTLKSYDREQQVSGLQQRIEQLEASGHDEEATKLLQDLQSLIQHT